MSDGRSARWIAGALALLGVLVAPLVAALTPAMGARQAVAWSGAGLLLMLIAFVIWQWSDVTGTRRRLASWEQVIQQMRNTGFRLDQLQRHAADLDRQVKSIAPTRQLLNEERHNLSLVASGMIEIRQIIDTERTNLGALAAGVHEVRVASEQRDLQTERFAVEVRDFAETVQAVRSHLDALSSGLASVDERLVAEQRNLGLVASGLDTIRRSASGVEAFGTRQAMFEDALLIVADRVDAMEAAPSVRGQDT